MKLMKRLFLGFALFAALSLEAQENWGLKKCIQYALEHNLKQQITNLNEEAARVNFTQSKLGLLPNVYASSSAGINSGRSVDTDTNEITDEQFWGSSGSLNATIPLFEGFMRINQIAYYKYCKQAAEWAKVDQQDFLAFSVMDKYYDVIFYKGLVEITREQVDLSAFNLKKTETEIETGLKAQMDLVEMQSAFERESLNLLVAENKLSELEISLAQQLNLPIEQQVQFNVEKEEPACPVLIALEQDSLFNSYVEQSAYVKMAEAECSAASKSVAVSRGSYFPSVRLNASIGTGYYETKKNSDVKTLRFSDQFDANQSQYVGASLYIPIFGRHEVRGQVKQAKIREMQAEAMLESSKQAVFAEFVNNYRNLNALYSQYNQASKQVEAEELAYKAAELKYDEGLIDVIELLTVKSRLADAKSSLLLSGLQWEVKARIIDFYQGVRFWE